MFLWYNETIHQVWAKKNKIWYARLSIFSKNWHFFAFLRNFGFCWKQEFLLQVVEDYRKKIDVTKKSGLCVC
jgi:hypothetical protein